MVAVRSVPRQREHHNQYHSRCNGGQRIGNQSSSQSGAQVRIGGTFFNSGSGNPGDDLTAYVIANHYGHVVDYGIWWGWQNQSQWVHLTYFPMGTPVTTTIRWDQSNHRFIALLKVTNGLYIAGTSSYPVADSMPAASPSKSLSAAT